MKIKYKTEDKDYTDKEIYCIYLMWTRKKVNIDPRRQYHNCGFATGYQNHINHKTPKCFPCKWANTAHVVNWRHKTGLSKKRINLPKCGELSGVKFHYKRKEKLCKKCNDANNKRERERRWKNGESIPLNEFLKKQPKPYTDYFNATFLGKLTEKIENRFDFWYNRITEHGFTRKQINEYHNQHFNCYHCGGHLLNKVIHVDHLLATSLGGRNEIENLVLSCAFCNISKNDKTLEEWFLYRSSISSTFEIDQNRPSP